MTVGVTEPERLPDGEPVLEVVTESVGVPEPDLVTVGVPEPDLVTVGDPEPDFVTVGDPEPD